MRGGVVGTTALRGCGTARWSAVHVGIGIATLGAAIFNIGGCGLAHIHTAIIACINASTVAGTASRSSATFIVATVIVGLTTTIGHCVARATTIATSIAIAIVVIAIGPATLHGATIHCTIVAPVAVVAVVIVLVAIVAVVVAIAIAVAREVASTAHIVAIALIVGHIVVVVVVIIGLTSIGVGSAIGNNFVIAGSVIKQTARRGSHHEGNACQQYISKSSHRCVVFKN